MKHRDKKKFMEVNLPNLMVKSDCQPQHKLNPHLQKVKILKFLKIFLNYINKQMIQVYIYKQDFNLIKKIHKLLTKFFKIKRLEKKN